MAHPRRAAGADAARAVLVALPADHPYRAVAEGRFRPRSAHDETQWTRAVPLLHQILADNCGAVHRSIGATGESRKLLAEYVYWLAGERDADQLTPDAALDENELQRYVRSPGATTSWRSGVARLSKLRRFRHAYPDWFPRRSIAPEAPELAPTTDTEFAWAWEAADTFRNPDTRDHVRGLLLLGRGAGLDGADMQYVSGDAIGPRAAAGVWVDVRRPGHERQVPVLARFAPRLCQLAAQAGPRGVISARVPPIPRGQPSEVAAILQRRLSNAHPHVQVSPGRLRKAWMAELLGRGAPVKVFLRAAGLASFRSIESLADHCPPAPDDPQVVAEMLGCLVAAPSVKPLGRVPLS